MAKKKTVSNGKRPVCFHPDTLALSMTAEDLAVASRLAACYAEIVPSPDMEQSRIESVRIAKYAMYLEQRLLAVQQCANGGL